MVGSERLAFWENVFESTRERDSARPASTREPLTLDLNGSEIFTNDPLLNVMIASIRTICFLLS